MKMKMKNMLALLLSMVLLLSIVSCGKTETPPKGDETPKDNTEENNQQKPDDPDEPVPTDPVSKEVYDLKHDEKLTCASLSFYEEMGSAPEEEPAQGSVFIWGNYLSLWLVIPKTGENSFDATVGYNKDDPDPTADYHFSFKLYLREKGVENAEYKVIHTNLVPWSIYNDSKTPIYRCPFYDSGLLDIVEVDKTYDVVIAIYENDKVVGWCENELTWYEDSQNFVEQAEQDESIIK